MVGPEHCASGGLARRAAPPLQAAPPDRPLQTITVSTDARWVVSPLRCDPSARAMFTRRYATSLTLGGFFVVAVALSAAPGLPNWLRPTDLLQAEAPVTAVLDALLAKPASIPLPDQQVDQLQATGDPLLLDAPVEPDEVPTEVEVRTSTAPRPKWERPERPRFDRYARRLGLKAAPLARPCLREGPRGCEQRALDRFFGVLEQVEQGQGKARILHFGDSLIASDKIADRVRLRMQQRFGSAGRGFLLPKRFNQFQRGNRSGRGSDGWALHTIVSALAKMPDRHFGISGITATAERRGETLRFEPVGASRELAVHYVATPRGGALEVRADGDLFAVLDTRAEAVTATVARYTLPEGTEKLVLRSRRRGPRIQGVSLEAKGPGITWSTLGLPGATSSVWLRPDQAEFERMLRGRGPHLAVIMLGGNDGLMLAKHRTTAAEIERDLAAFIERIRSALPEVDCLLVTPLEAVRAKTGGRLVPKPEVKTIIALTERVAQTKGCGLWDMYASMGGPGSLKRWVDARLMLGDLIHPRSRGSDLLGEMMAESIMEAYDARGREN